MQTHVSGTTHQHNQIWGILPGLVGGKCLCVFGGGGYSFRGGEKKHIDQIPRKSRDNPAKVSFICFLVYCFFFPTVPEGRKHS